MGDVGATRMRTASLAGWRNNGTLGLVEGRGVPILGAQTGSGTLDLGRNIASFGTESLYLILKSLVNLFS